MKLSEAIRLGAMALPQGFGAGSAVSPVATCAIGAALHAVGRHPEQHLAFYEMWQQWPWTSLRYIEHPVHWRQTEFTDVVWQLNDSYRWTREQIADWVESVERAHESQPEIVVAVTA